MHENSASKRKEKGSNKFDTSASSPIFAKFTKKKDHRLNQMHGRFIQKSKDISFKLNSTETFKKLPSFRLVNEMDPVCYKNIQKKLRKSKKFPKTKVHIGSVPNQQVLVNDDAEFSLNETLTNPKRKISNAPASDTSKEQTCESAPLLKQRKFNRGIDISPQAEVNICNEQILGNKKLSKKQKSGLQKIIKNCMSTNSMQESNVPNAYEETQQPKKLKKKRKITQTVKSNTCSSILGEVKENDINSKVNPTASSKAIRYEDQPTSDLSKRKKRKYSFSESSDLQFCDVNESLSSDSNLKKRHQKRHRKNSESLPVPLNQQIVVGQIKGGIFKQKINFFQQTGINQGNNSVSKKKNKLINLNRLVGKTMIEIPAGIDDEIKRTSKKNKKKEQSFSENFNLISDAKKLHTGFCEQKQNFKIDYGSDRIVKQNKKCNKKIENSFVDVMQDACTAKNAIKRFGSSTRIMEDTSVVGDEGINESKVMQLKTQPSKIDSSDFIRLPKKELRGFVGREDTLERFGRTVFVGNLPLSADKKVLQTLFRNFGKIESVRFRSVVPAKSSVPKKVAMITKEFHSDSDSLHGYVVFETLQEAENALALNKTVIEGHHIRVDLLKKSNDYDNKRSIFIGNLPFSVTDESLWTAFGDCGNIEAVRVVRDPLTGLGKGFGFVQFEKKGSVRNALLLNEAEILGRRIRVKPAEKGKSKHKTSEKNQQSTLKIEKKNVGKCGWRLAGQKKSKKKLIKKQKCMQKKKYIVSILTQE